MSSGRSGRGGGRAGRKSAGRKGETGRCSIYDEIDGLADCLALAETQQLPAVVAALQGVLNRMAYYMVNSDGAVLEDTEHWHTTFTGRLYEAAGQARSEAAERAGAAASGHRASSSSSSSASGGGHATMPPMPARQPAGSIPASLQRILNGSHESLRDDDDDPV